jgi:hypothetical protein
LFVLRQHVELYRIYQKKIDDCDLQSRKHLESLGGKVDLPARKLACLLYRLIKRGKQYVDKGTEYHEAKPPEQQIRLLAKGCKSLACNWLFRRLHEPAM